MEMPIHFLENLSACNLCHLVIIILLVLFIFRPATIRKKKSNTEKKQKSTKMLVRNIPFQANRKEITELFK